jgi:release factor glutamine methyltransferase
VSALRVLLGDAALRLSVAGIDRPRLDARLLLAHAMRVSPDTLLGSIGIPADARIRFEAFLARRILREPLAYITGKKEFWSLEFDVGPGVLIPRPETETLVEQVLERFPEWSQALEIVDFGTGTGCLLAACLSEYPNARGLGVETSDTALPWARRNIDRLGLSDRCGLELADWRRILSVQADVIVSNPPYVRSRDIPLLAPDVRLFEPVSALDGGEDGLEAYRALAPVIGRLLKPGGLLFLEIGAGQEKAVSAILAGQRIGIVAIATDLAGIGRCIVAGPNARNSAK